MLTTLFASILALGQVGLHETLSGTLTGSELILRLDGSDVVCRGHLTDLVEGEGRGSLVCSDHRAGYFLYHRDRDGTGSADGRLDGEPLSLTFP